MPSPVCTADVDLNARINLAAQQNAVPIIRQIRLTNARETALDDVLVRVTCEPAFAEPWEGRIAEIRPGATAVLNPVDLRLSPSFLRAQREREAGEIVIEVCAGDEDIHRSRKDVEVLAPNEWSGVAGLPELLAAFVQPNHASLPPILKSASTLLDQYTGSPALDGYQSRSPSRAKAIAEALYKTVQDSGVTYINPPASFEKTGQKVRPPDEILRHGLGTCLDLTLLLCGLMEQAGLHPFIVVVNGHAFPGLWLTDFSLFTPAVDDPAPIRKRIRLGEAMVFDSSAVASSVRFSRAIEVAHRHLDDTDSFVFAVDVHRAREQRILPLTSPGPIQPIIEEAPAPEHELELDLGDTTDDADDVDLSDFVETQEHDTPGGERLVRWKDKLLDLSLRNKLLAFRETARTIPFPHLDLPALEDTLATGQPLIIVPRPQLLDEADPRDAVTEEARSGEDARAAYIREEQTRGRMCADLPPAELFKRLLELYRRARSSVEETGAVTLYLGIGSLIWYESDNSEVARRAPLLLLPIDLKRGRGPTPWRLQLAEDEPRINVTLLKKLSEDFGLDVSGMDVLPEDHSGIDIPAVFRRYTRLVIDKDRWDVREDCFLAQFSFTKFLMWLDLEAKTEHLLNNNVVRHIFEGKGEAFPREADFVSLDRLDEDRPPTSVLPVVSADPSQTQAILAALDGNSFVLQGPPGTGKSQTITNLIATLLAKRRTVLFVSEKRAALEVVQRRLDGVGLGPFCLELHSHKASKRQVMEQLAAALDNSSRHPPDGWDELARRLEATRRQLNSVAAALREPTPFGDSVQHNLTVLVGLREADRIVLSEDAIRDMTPERLVECREAAEKLSRACGESGSPAGHPWAAASVPEWTPTWQREIEGTLQKVVQAFEDLERSRAAALRILGLPKTFGGDLTLLRRLAEVATRIVESPSPPLALLEADMPAETRDRIEVALQHVTRRGDAWEKVSEAFTEHLLQQDLVGIRGRFVQWGGSFFLLAWLMLFRVRSRLRAVAVQGAPLPPNTEMVGLLDSAIDATREDDHIADLDGPMRTLLGSRWRGKNTDNHEARSLHDDADAFRLSVLKLVAHLDLAEAGPARARLFRLYTVEHELVGPETERGATLRRLRETVQHLDRAWEALAEALVLDEAARGPGPEALANTTEELGKRLRIWTEALPGLRDWSFTLQAMRTTRAIGLAPVVDALHRGEVAPDRLPGVVERSLRETWWDLILERSSLLRELRGVDHEAVIQRFHSMDDEALSLAREVVAARIAEDIPDVNAPGSEMATLKHQLLLKKRHKPLRKLFAQIPNLLRKLKPCVLMSPLSVAQFLDPELPGFDVVIFDEASQIPPWEAVGAIARGRQVVIVGDSKQLPPTTFFHASDQGDDPLDDEDRIDLDSILEEAVGAGIPQHRLSWHYRSRHESLIAFSNHHYYEGRLRTFPSAAHEVSHLGVHLHPVPHGFYDRGASRTNAAEAEAIRDEVKRLLRLPLAARPTVGVVTFSMPQQRLIEDLLDRLRSEHPELEEAFHGDGIEPVFVKNLENIQGDERDVILFSVGYGPDRSGRLTMNFGPLNKEGGERRLNVAITRARERVVVFSTLRADQIDLSRSRSKGVEHLKTYLEYAERGFAAINAAASLDPGAEPESPLEREIKAALEGAGWTVHAQVGVSGYRIDLAVVDPDKPGAYVVGIECDGATYHSSAVARERDRLRQQVLEGLGWRIVRVWSTDWWHAHQATARRLLDSVQSLSDEARQQARLREEAERVSMTTNVGSDPSQTKSGRLLGSSHQRTPPPDGTSPASLARIRDALESTVGVEPPRDAPTWTRPSLAPAPSVLDFYDRSSRAVVGAMIAQLVADSGPIVENHAWQIIREAWGLGRLGKRIREALETALAALPPERQPQRARGTLWWVDQDPTEWLVFRVPGDRRKIREIPLVEAANAHEWVLGQSGGVGVEIDELCRATMGLFGFQHFGRQVRDHLEEAAELLVELKRARRVGDRYLLC